MRTEGSPPSEGHNRASDSVTAAPAGGNQRLVAVGDESRPVQVGAIYKSKNVNIVVNYEGSSVSIADTAKSVSDRRFVLTIQRPLLGAGIGLCSGMVIALALHSLGLAQVPWLVAVAVVGAALAVLTWLGSLVWRGLPSAPATGPMGGEEGLGQTVALATLAADHVPGLVDTAYKKGLDGEVIRTLWELGEQVAEIQRTLLRRAPHAGKSRSVPAALLAQCSLVLKDIVLLGQVLEREGRESLEKRLASLADRLRRVELELTTLP
jgi:hypothetical protein